VSAKVERLVNLTIALLEARRPLTMDDIRHRTADYGQSDPESARRMFERDKDALRSLGVPVQVAVDPYTGEVGYLVDRRDYEQPDVEFEREEVAALAVALRLTGQPDDRLALSKLAARAPDPGATPDVDARLLLPTEGLDAIADALVERRTLTFRYRTATGEEAPRTVDPYGVGLRRGAWYVVGRDHDRDDIRAFRTDRIVGAVRPSSPPTAFTPPADLDVASHIAGPIAGERDVDVAIAPAAEWAAAARGGQPTDTVVGGRRVHRFVGADPVRLIPWIMSLGPDAVVVAPPDIRDEVVARFRALASATA
jgi:proteasome accessory factor B